MIDRTWDIEVWCEQTKRLIPKTVTLAEYNAMRAASSAEARRKYAKNVAKAFGRQ